VALTLLGRVLRFPLAAHAEPSTKNGRKLVRLDDGDAVFAVLPSRAGDRVSAATRGGRAIVFAAEEVGVLKAAGKGVTGIKLRDGDAVMAFGLFGTAEGGVDVVTSRGRELCVSERVLGLSHRGAKGNVILQVGSIETWRRGPDLQLGPVTEPPPEDAPTS
jgi:DNA gyrase/topoisomerase IV subunit A